MNECWRGAFIKKGSNYYNLKNTSINVIFLTLFLVEPSRYLDYHHDCFHQPRPQHQFLTHLHFHFRRGVVQGAEAGHCDAGQTFSHKFGFIGANFNSLFTLLKLFFRETKFDYLAWGMISAFRLCLENFPRISLFEFSRGFLLWSSLGRRLMGLLHHFSCKWPNFVQNGQNIWNKSRNYLPCE